MTDQLRKILNIVYWLLTLLHISLMILTIVVINIFDISLITKLVSMCLIIGIMTLSKKLINIRLNNKIEELNT